MDAIWALGSILGILGVVIVGGYMLAVLVNMISGAFSGSSKSSKKSADVLDYTEYKALNNENIVTNENVLATSVDETKAKEEAEEVGASAEDEDQFKLEENVETGDLDEIEKRLKDESQKTEVVTERVEADDIEDEDLDSLLDGIANDVIEDTKEEIDAKDEESAKPDSALDNYSIDDILENINNESGETEEIEDNAEVEAEEVTGGTEEVNEDAEETAEQEESEAEEVAEPVEEEVVEDTTEEKEDDRKKEVEELKRQVEELNRLLDAARNSNAQTEIVIDMTEEQCLAKIEQVEERLKNLKKDYKINLKEYKPLRKVRDNLEKYQTKLRRREAVAAKKKVALYGVNNYVDIDKEKAEKLANELELLDGLRLSVQHCEEVIESSKDRYPILENTNNILEEQIANTEADLNELQIKLQAIRDRQGK